MPIDRDILNDSKQPLRKAAKSSRPTERQLESFIASVPEVLSRNWMLIGRQEHANTGARIDLLAITPQCSLVLIELKRARTPRDIVAQTLEYAAWVEQLAPEDIRQIYRRFSKGDVLDDAFKKHFGFDLNAATLNNSHEIVIVAPELDASSERIITYLSARNVAIRFLLFQVPEHATSHPALQVQVPSKHLLFDIARKQGGMFTAKQAETAGFQRRNHAYHVSMGNWVREVRGVYRLDPFPVDEHKSLILYSLWSRDRSDRPTGVYSHETALKAYNLLDVMPDKLHMTVPRSFRRNAPVPNVLVLHRANLQPADMEERQGYMVTRPITTLIDLIRAETLPEEILRDAFAEASQKGLITQREIAQHQSALSGVIDSPRSQSSTRRIDGRVA
jgi:hypothetical protein